MIKYYCDGCDKEIAQDQTVRITYKVVKNSRAVADNFLTGMNELGKDFCPDCARRFIGQRTIDRTIQYNLDRKARMMKGDNE